MKIQNIYNKKFSPTVLTVVIVFNMLPEKLFAAEWSMEPVVAVSYAYNDNIQMKVIPVNSAFITKINPVLDFTWASERTEIDMKGEWKHLMYSGDASRGDNTFETYTFNTTHKTEINRLALIADIKKDTTLTQDTYNESLGVVYQELDQQVWTVSPSWLWIMTENSSLKLEYSYQQAEYEKYYESKLNNYSYDSTGLTYFYQWSEKDQVYGVVSFSHYEMDDLTDVQAQERPTSGTYSLTSVSDTTSYQLGLNHQFTETFKVGLGYGSRSTKTDSLLAECALFYDNGRCAGKVSFSSNTDTTSPIYTLTAEQNFELTKLSLNVNRTISASGLSSEVEIDKLDITMARDITRLIDLDLNVSINKRKATNEAFSSDDRDQYRGMIKLAWKFSENGSLALRYRYTQTKNNNNGAEPESNYYAMTVRYNWDKYSVSR